MKHKYTILKTVLCGNDLIGYIACDWQGKNIVIATFKAKELSKINMISNAMYDKNRDVMYFKGVKMRDLPVVQYYEIIESVYKRNSIAKRDGKTNHELANNFMAKQAVMGAKLFDFLLLPNDEVMISMVFDKDNTEEIIIPQFVSGGFCATTNKVNFGSTLLIGSKYSSVKVDNRDGYYFNAKKLCFASNSDTLSVYFRHPEYVVAIDYLCSNCAARHIEIKGFSPSIVFSADHMFDRCSNLESIDLSELDLSIAKSTISMFSFCRKLKSVDLSKSNAKNVERMAYMFRGCSSIEYINLRGFNPKVVLSQLGAFEYCDNLAYIELDTYGKLSLNEMRKIAEAGVY